MRYLMISGLILISASIFSIGTMFWVSEVAESTASMLEQSQEQAEAGDMEAAGELVNAASDYWKANNAYLCIVMRHDEVNFVTGELARLHASKEQDEFFITCAGLLSELEMIAQMEKPSLQNIF